MHFLYGSSYTLKPGIFCDSIRSSPTEMGNMIGCREVQDNSKNGGRGWAAVSYHEVSSNGRNRERGGAARS